MDCSSRRRYDDPFISIDPPKVGFTLAIGPRSGLAVIVFEVQHRSLRTGTRNRYADRVEIGRHVVVSTIGNRIGDCHGLEYFLRTRESEPGDLLRTRSHP